MRDRAAPVHSRNDVILRLVLFDFSTCKNKSAVFLIAGVAFGSRNGDLVQGDTFGEHRRRAPREIARLCSPWPLRQPLPHKCFRPRVRSLLGQLHQQSR